MGYQGCCKEVAERLIHFCCLLIFSCLSCLSPAHSTVAHITMILPICVLLLELFSQRFLPLLLGSVNFLKQYYCFASFWFADCSFIFAQPDGEKWCEPENGAVNDCLRKCSLKSFSAVFVLYIEHFFDFSN